jgi:hypothetical protein
MIQYLICTVLYCTVYRPVQYYNVMMSGSKMGSDGREYEYEYEYDMLYGIQYRYDIRICRLRLV